MDKIPNNFLEICSQYKNLFFVHIPKTAGSYISNVVFKEELGRRVFLGGHCVFISRSLTYYNRAWNTRCQEIEGIENSLIFSVIRNPLDLLVSMYTYGFPYYFPGLQKTGCMIRRDNESYFPFDSFYDFCQKYCHPDFPWLIPEQKKFMFFQLFDENGVCRPHFLLRQETLDESLKLISEALHLKADISGTRVNNSRQGLAVDYRNFYTPELLALASRKLRRELEAFGYSYEGHDGRVIIDPSNIHYNIESDNYWRLDPPSKFDHLTLPENSPHGELSHIDFHPFLLKGFHYKEIIRALLFKIKGRIRRKFRSTSRDRQNFKTD